MSSPPIPQELWKLMADLGPRWLDDVPGHVKLMIDEFSKVQKNVSNDGVERRNDVAYGPHPRQQFDVFSPAAGGRNRPAVLFVHGGAFVDGHRNRTPEIYGNVPHYFAR